MGCSIIACTDYLPVSSWLKKILGEDANRILGVTIIEESGIDSELLCDNGESWQSIFKNAIRLEDGCYKIAVTKVTGYNKTIEDCTDILSPDSIAKRLFVMEGECLSIRVQEEAATDKECDDVHGLFHLLKSAIRVHANGNFALAVSIGEFADCALNCDEIPVMALGSSLIKASYDYPGSSTLQVLEAAGPVGFKVSGGANLNIGFETVERYPSINDLSGDEFDNEGFIVHDPNFVDAPNPPTSYLDVVEARTYNHHFRIAINISTWIVGVSAFSVRLRSGETIYTHTDEDIYGGGSPGVGTSEFQIDRTIAYLAGAKEYFIIDATGLINGAFTFIEWSGS